MVRVVYVSDWHMLAATCSELRDAVNSSHEALHEMLRRALCSEYEEVHQLACSVGL